MAAAVKRFLEECFDGLFHEGYGATEVIQYMLGSVVAMCVIVCGYMFYPLS